MSSIPSSLVSTLMEIQSTQKNLMKSNSRLDHAVRNSLEKGLPEISILPEQGAYLALLCKVMRARSVLELGTLGGYSTIWLAESVPGIQVTSVEVDQKHYDAALDNTKELENVELILGAALDVLSRFTEEGQTFDFVFIDADWEQQQQYFSLAVELTRSGGCILVDNVVRQLIEDDDRARGQALLEYVKADDRVEVAMVPIVNTYAREIREIVDGFLMAVKK